MPPRLSLPSPSRRLRLHLRTTQRQQRQQQPQHQQPQQPPHISSSSHGYASIATAPAPSPDALQVQQPISRFPPTQPPSYKPPEFRKTQLHRQYTSLLRSSPLILLFQHNNLRATEWSGIRRELNAALRKLDAELGLPDSQFADAAKTQIVQTGIFASALKVVEFWKPEDITPDDLRAAHPSASIHGTTRKPNGPAPSHSLSKQAWVAAKRNTAIKTGLEPLLSGPLMLVSFPAVSPQHLKTVLSILAPSEKFPAPKRKVNPGLWEPNVQTGLQKIMLLGARVEGKVFDVDGTRWVGGIDGGLDGLRSQLVYLLQSVSAGITNTLEGAGKSLYVTMESRRQDLEGPAEEKKDPAEEEKKE